jgi:hypothetical protein
MRLSRCFIKHRCKYPDREVLTAVSINPSRPAMQWKKYSTGRIPKELFK